MSSKQPSNVLMGLAALVAVVSAAALALVNGPEPPASPQTGSPSLEPIAEVKPATSYELPAIRPSPYLNTTAAAVYLGANACRECHADEFESYLQTPHSQALGEIDVNQEPPDTEFVHAASARSYRVYRDRDRMRHREWRAADDGSEIAFADYAMRYVIGSGNNSRSYLVEDDGFLVESPLTWFASTQGWSMSPGFDQRHHMGFERMVELGCLFCHAGRIENKDDNRYKVKIHEMTIGCESCHGPGSLHVARHRSGEAYEEGQDLTIVNPEQLSRQANESVCGFCHLRGEASVWMHGRVPMDFRPGLMLSDFRIDFQLKEPDKSMKVVGHIEQMKLSKCYQESESMTCTTCHDPHGRPPQESKWDYFRQRCLSCHDSGCGLDAETRLRQNAENNCIACHMKQAETDIVHFTFTHHRIGFHDPADDESRQVDVIGELVPIGDVDHLAEAQQELALGMAYLEFSATAHSDHEKMVHRGRAASLLTKVYQQGLRDAQLEASLAILAWERNDLQRAVQLASLALQRPACSSPAHATALYVLGDSHLKLNNAAAAKSALERLVKYRRFSADRLLLARARAQTGDRQGAIAALEKASQMSPFRADVHQMLAFAYDSVGRADQAEQHRRIAESLQQSGPSALPAAQRAGSRAKAPDP